MTQNTTDAALLAAAEEYVYNPDTPYCCSGIRGETSVDPEEAFKAGARWQAALSRHTPESQTSDAMVERCMNEIREQRQDERNGLVFSWDQVENGIRAAITAIQGEDQ